MEPLLHQFMDSFFASEGVTSGEKLSPSDEELIAGVMPYDGINRRWYDQIAHMTTAIHLSQHLPNNIQTLIAKNLNEYIDNYRMLSKNDKNAISLGSTKVLGLYKAGEKKRWYDQANPQLFRAFNMMTSVPEPFLSRFANRVIDVAMYLDYKREKDSHYDPFDLVESVDNILAQSFVSLSDRDGDIRLVFNSPKPDDAHYDDNRFVVPAHEKKKK